MSDVVYQPYGAAQTVTGSRHLIKVGGRSVLLDCGLYQGPRKEAEERNRHLPLPKGMRSVVLSHAHIDHSGAIPALVRSGFRGKIYATPATRDLCKVMLADSAYLQEADARYLNKRRPEGTPKVRPLYTKQDVAHAMTMFRPRPLDEPFKVTKRVSATLREAGHILGSAGVLLTIEDGPRIYFTGDLGRQAYPILRDPAPIPECDVILTECTYGLREHGPIADAEATTRKIFERAVRLKGKVIVPAFSVGRTQNLIYGFAQLKKQGLLPDIPIFVDSPLAMKATQVFVDHPECYDAETREFIGHGGHPFHPHGVHYIETRTASKMLNEEKGPFVVVSASGMCEGGRIVHHLLHGLDDERNSMLFVGYAARHTLARRIMDGEKRVRVMGQWKDVKVHVERIDAFSAHADSSDIVDFLAPAKEWGSKIFLIHGDEDVCYGFRQRLLGEGHQDVVVPDAYAQYPLGATLPTA